MVTVLQHRHVQLFGLKFTEESVGGTTEAGPAPFNVVGGEQKGDGGAIVPPPTHAT